MKNRFYHDIFTNSDDRFPEGDVILLFALSAESKKDKNLCVLSVSAVT
jgi:hypothetical protein